MTMMRFFGEMEREIVMSSDWEGRLCLWFWLVANVQVEVRGNRTLP
jgi:hypothetical protein